MWWEIKGHLEVKNGELCIAGYSAIELAGKFGTPLYVYNGKRILENYRRFYDVLKKNTDKQVRIHYAMKANSNPNILNLLKEEGSWIDAVSPEEVKLAINTGFEEEKILFTGSSLSHQDLLRIADYRIRINVDSISVLKKMQKLNMKNEISIRIDPGIRGLGQSWHTITAGKEHEGIPIKFSIPENEIKDVARFAKENGFKVKGLHEHVGSNWRAKEEVDEFLETARILIKKAFEVKEIGHEIEFLDFGGGPGVRYKKEQDDFPLDYYSEKLCRIVEESKIEIEALSFEPGRYIVADAGLLLVEVTDVKIRYGEVIVGVNSGFNHLIRPLLYNAYHEIINCNDPYSEGDAEVTIVGNLCETGDIFALKRKMKVPREGDILAIHNAGAYGYSMASRYNSRSLPKEALIIGDKVLLSEEYFLRNNKAVFLNRQ